MRSRKTTFAVAIGALALVAGAAAVALVPALNWRAKVIVQKATGRLPQIDWSELPWMLKPDPDVFLVRMGDPPNPFAAIKNPLTSPADVAAGKVLFERHCAACHGSEARGGRGGPSLHGRTFLQGRSDWALFRTITHGIPGTPMAGWKLDHDEVWKLVAYLNSILGQGPPKATSATSVAQLISSVSAAELVHAEDDPSEWLTYSGSYTGQRYSRVNSIDHNNVQHLRVAWVRQLATGDGQRLEASPVVRGSTMFVTTGWPSKVYALDALTGRVLWTYEHELASRLSVCCGTVNRGVALLGDRVFFGTLDAHLIALDANTGKLLWDVTVADSSKGYSITGAPLAVNDMVVTGMSGGDYPTRGFLDAYDAATGKRRWRFYTVPSPDEPGGDTWEGDSYRTGGGPTWLTGSFDPELGLLYWGIGNPNPDYFGDSRKGDNLYTDSVVALDAATGKLRWHFQFTPHDTYDWDATQIPVLIDGVAGFPKRKLMAWANRNGFYYLLDRTTGKFLLGTSFLRQNWADGLDSNGRPRVRPSAIPTKRGVVVYPRTLGATSWWSPAYDPELQLLYVPTMDGGSIITATGVGETADGVLRHGSTFPDVPNEPLVPAVKALDVNTGQTRWQYRRPTRLLDGEIGGLMSTAGGLVFGGDLDTFFALDSRTGTKLWEFNAGGHVIAAPVTYALKGRQYVVMTAGRSIFAFALPESSRAATR